MASEGKEKETTKDTKKVKVDPTEPIRALLERPTVPESIQNSIKNVDIQREFDASKIAKTVMKALDPILVSEIERYSMMGDAFDKLVSNEEETEQSCEKLEFCLDALKIFANELPDLCELMLLKFKNTLIRCVLCNNVPDNLRNEAALICERIMEKTQYVEDDNDIVVGEKWLSVYFWVLKRSLSEGASRNDVKRVWAMHRLLNRYIVTDSSAAVTTLKAVVVSPNFLMYKEGRQNIAYVLSFNKTLVVPFYTKIKAALPTVAEKSKALACFYGEVFNMAWTHAIQEVREVLEDEIFQRLMEIYLKLDRPNNLQPSFMGKVIFRILSHLHNSRRLLQLSSAITRLYEPILWRAMKSHHPLERCNAAELFLDVFPLERPEATIVENSNLMEKQFNQIMALLKDESHFTRIVTIRGVILVFQRRIECLSNNHCREILSWLANELANDGSSYLVRVAVWEFFTSLAASDNPPEFLRSLLPQLTNHFHDTSESVRKSFTLMLIKVGESNKLGISVTDIAPKAHLIARLALEGETVGKLLSKLLMKSVYSDGMIITEFVSRLKRMIIQSPQAAENLFRWSANVLTVQNAHFIIMAVLVYLRQFTKDRLLNRPGGSGKSTCSADHSEQSDDKLLPTSDKNDDDEDGPEVDIQDIENTPLVANQPPVLSASPAASPVKKKRRKNKNTSAQQNCDETKNDDEEIIDIDGPTAEIHAHMIGCVHTVWVVFSQQFASHPTMVSELNQVLTVCLQNYLRCYKGTPAWYATLSMASLVPLTKLSENTTASSSCLAELRRTELDTPLAHTEALIYTLTAWNRGYEIIELAIDYIDPAFKLFQLNSSSYPTIREGHGGPRNRVVRFMKDGGKEMIGLRLLSLLFKDHHNETRILKHHDRIFELYSYLEGIKVIIEVRYNEGLSEESVHVITDAFIRECFDIMVDLIPVLNKEESDEDTACQAFSSTQHMINIIEWAIRVLLPHVKEIEIPVEAEENEDEDEEEDSSEDEESGNDKVDSKRKNKKKNTKKKTKKKKSKKIVEVKEDLCVSILKSVIKESAFMIRTKITDTDHIIVSSNFALSLIKSEGKYWFTEDCIDLVEAISEHTRAWCPKDEDQFLSVICPSVYSHILLSLTANAHLTIPYLKRYDCDLGYIRRKLLIFPGLLFTMYGANSEKFLKVFRSIIGSCVAAIQAEAIKIETIETEGKVEDLPLGVSMVTQSILARPKLLPLILPSLLDFALTNREDGVLVVCALSYLFTLLDSNSKKFDRLDMVETVQSLYKLVQTLSPPAPSKHSSPKKGADNDEDKQSDSEDSFFLEPLSRLDAKKIGIEILHKIADSISCQLVKPLTSVSSRKSAISETVDKLIVPSISGLKV